jgi:esterase/lipase superfamily enzyme
MYKVVGFVFALQGGRFRRGLAAILAALVSTVSTPAAGDDTVQHRRKDVMTRSAESLPISFVTLRNRTESSEPAEYFDGTRGRLRTGTCTVKFSPIWKLDRLAEAAPFHIPDEKITLTDIRETTLELLYDEISSFARQDNGNIVIYIHGYNIDFERSCRQAAIFQRALGLHDRLILLSWPSDGNMLKYTWDEADLVWSVPHMVQFFEEIAKRAGSAKVDVVAHSLGARGAVQALARIGFSTSAVSIVNELVLVAPDMDSDIFRQELPLIRRTANRITVYASENDNALKLSHEVHGYPRLGMSGEYLTVLQEVETIDLSLIGIRKISGHLYHLFNPEVINDLTTLLHTGAPAEKRPSLKTMERNGLPYWQMMPEGG